MRFFSTKYSEVYIGYEMIRRKTFMKVMLVLKYKAEMTRHNCKCAGSSRHHQIYPQSTSFLLPLTIKAEKL